MPGSRYSKSQKAVPACELEENCPAAQECKSNSKQLSERGSDSGKNGKYQFRYWHLLAALIVTGVVYKVIQCEKVFTRLRTLIAPVFLIVTFFLIGLFLVFIEK